MGQCPMVPPPTDECQPHPPLPDGRRQSGAGDGDGDGDGVGVGVGGNPCGGLASAGARFARAGGLTEAPAAGPSGGGASGATAPSSPPPSREEQFLAVHRFDRASRCIIDPADVVRALEYQAAKAEAAELARERDLSKAGTIPSESSDLLDGPERDDADAAEGVEARAYFVDDAGGGAAPPSPPPSDRATQITVQSSHTATTLRTSEAVSDMTQPTCNRDRYATKRRFRARGTHTGRTVAWPPGPDTEPGASVPDFVQGGAAEAAARVSPGAGGGPLSQSTCLAPIVPLFFREAPEEEEDDDNPPRSLPAADLHLRMRAHLMNFYRNDYLRAFPRSPVPGGIERSPKCPGGGGDLHAQWRQTYLPRLAAAARRASETAPAAAPSAGDARPECSCPVDLAVDGSPFLDLAVDGSLGLIDRTPEPVGTAQASADPALAPDQQQKSPRHYLVLRDRTTHAPIAVCALKSPQGEPIVRIYATKPRIKGQKAAASTADLGLSPGDEAESASNLYAWAELAVEGEFPRQVQYSIYNSMGSDGKFEREPSYRGTHSIPGSPDVMVAGRTGDEVEYRGCCLVNLQSDEDMEEDEAYFHLSISHGMDPAIFICLTAIIDEITELSMRKCYISQPKKSSRRSKQKD